MFYGRHSALFVVSMLCFSFAFLKLSLKLVRTLFSDCYFRHALKFCVVICVRIYVLPLSKIIYDVSFSRQNSPINRTTKSADS